MIRQSGCVWIASRNPLWSLLLKTGSIMLFSMSALRLVLQKSKISGLGGACTASSQRIVGWRSLSLEFLSKLPSDKYISHLEDCMKLAIDDNDYDWIYGIFYLIENAQIQEKDFNNKYIYKKSKEIYDTSHP